MNRALGAVFHFWAQFFLAIAVDGLWITWKNWMNLFRDSGFADASAAGAAIFAGENVNWPPV
jgi:hypothetical protein